MAEEHKHGTFIHGIGASEVIDSSGEKIIVKGIDISSLALDGVFNWEHKSDQTSHIVGKILEAKKILKESDCTNDHHRKFWNKIKVPFIYVAGELFDGVNHPAAVDVAAMLRYDGQIDKRKTKKIINFSIEGSRLGKEGSRITKCIARKMTITVLPCNKTCEAEELKKPKETMKTKQSVIEKILNKSEENVCELLKGEYTPALAFKLKPKEPSAKATFKPKPASSGQKEGVGIKPKRTFTSQTAPKDMKVGDRITYPKRPKTGAELYSDPDTFKSEKKKIKLDKYVSNMRKALTASCGAGTPATKTGMAALGKEEVVKVCKSISNDNWDIFSKKEDLVAFLEGKLPNLGKKEIIALAKTVAFLHEKKKETKLESLDV